MKLSGKHALVTGASRGPGRAAARALAGAGCDLTLAGRDVAALEFLARTLTEAHDIKTAVIEADLSESVNADVLALECPSVDILVNAQGSIPPGGIADFDQADWSRHWRVKVLGTVALTREIMETMAEQGEGTVITVLSPARPPAANLAAEMIDAALCAFTTAVAAEAGPVRVLAVRPSPKSTPDFLGTAIAALAEDGPTGVVVDLKAGNEQDQGETA